MSSITATGIATGLATHTAAGTSSAGFTRLRMTTRGRRVLIALIVLPLVIAAFFAALNGGQAGASNESVSDSSTYITVGSGESLWQIAERVAPSADPRDVVDALVSYNHLEGDIQAGQRVAIPAQYK